MKTVEWRSKVRITVGEVTRAGQLQLSRNVNFAAESNIDLMAEIAEELTVAATRKIEVFEDGEWVSVKRPITVEHEGEDLVFSFPATASMLRALPVSLTNEWLTAAGAENEYLQNLLFFGRGGGASTTNTSAPPSAPEPSTAPESENSPLTKTDGTTTLTPNT